MAVPQGDLKPPSRSARDAAAVLPFAATALLMPPIILIFARPALFAGVPLIIVYIFGVWAAIVAASFLIARALQRGDDAAAAGTGEPASMDEP